MDKSSHAGMVWVNNVNLAYPNTPWIGGYGSGVELGMDGIREYCRI